MAAADARRRILGLITVDDVLETTLPDDWRQREIAGRVGEER